MANHIFIQVKKFGAIVGYQKQCVKSVMFFCMAMLIALLTACKDNVDVSPRPSAPAKEGIVKLDNANIHIKGAVYVTRTSAKISFKRFSEATLNLPADTRRFATTYALSTTGISIQFKTKSSSIKMTFPREEGVNERGSFKVLRDGADLKTVSFAASVSTPIEIELTSLPTDKEYLYEVILPSYTNVSLTKLELDKGSVLATYTPPTKDIYLSFGDSITHGVGQGGATYLSYPYLLAQKLNMDMYNLAVSGAKISMPIAQMSNELPQADIITLLIAYNDYSSGNRTVSQINNDYREHLTEIRKNQPKAQIYCVTLLHTTNSSNATTGLTPDDVRNVVKNIVTEYQVTDSKLHLIEGDKIINSSSYLADQVHLNVAGASKLADELYTKIKNP